MSGPRDGMYPGYSNVAISSQHYSHPYAPYGEPSQPLRAGHDMLARGMSGSAEETYCGRAFGDQAGRASSSSQTSLSSFRQRNDDSGPIPAPVVKAEYAAPVFKTFQERKRAKEMALRAAAGDDGPVRHQWSRSDTDSSVTTSSDSLSSNSRSHTPNTPLVERRTLPAPPPVKVDTRPRTPESPVKSVFSAPLPKSAGPAPGRPLPSPINVNTAIRHAGPSSPRSPATAFSPVSASTQVLDRSDTISSVKSLDRGMGYGSPSKRPLPKPPVAVNTSKSLDRGVPSGIGGVGMSTPMALAEGYSRKTGRKLPSTVTELSEGSEDGLSFDTSRISLNRSPSPTKRPIKSASSPTIPSIVLPSGPGIRFEITPEESASPFPSMHITGSTESSSHANAVIPPILVETPPSEVEPSSSTPATFTPLPSINIGDSDEDEVATPSSGIVYGDLPVIAVSSSDVSDVISIQVPDIHEPSRKLSTPASKPVSVGPTRIDPSAAIICAGCSDPIIGRIVSAMDQRWHPQCFTCGECGELLEHVSSYEYHGKPYCHLDYHDKFAHRCHHCKTPIVEPRFITLDDPVLGQRYYHELHFFCSECGDPFLDPSKSSAPGTERNRLHMGEEEETNAFVIQKGHPYCERCHLRLHKPKCKGCKRPIPDVAVDAMNGKWHQECFVCVECGNTFANSLFFPKDDKAFCTECYAVMLGD